MRNLGLPDRVLAQPLRTLSGGQRRRVELARILFAASEAGVGGKSSTMLLLDEPTNHLDADSVTWLRGFLKSHDGGLVVISHDVELLADVVNKVWFLDATRGEVDLYNMGWQRYLDARADRREAAAQGAGQRGEEGLRADGAGRQDAREGDQGGRRAEHGPAGGKAAVRSGGGPPGRQGRQDPVPGTGAVRQDPVDREQA